VSAEEITVKKIVYEYLLSHGYDGLCFDDCGCKLEDLMPGECPNHNCIPGHIKLNYDGSWIIQED
jgi:hypothetical protein